MNLATVSMKASTAVSTNCIDFQGTEKKKATVLVAFLLCVDTLRNGIDPFFALRRGNHLGEEAR